MGGGVRPKRLIDVSPGQWCGAIRSLLQNTWEFRFFFSPMARNYPKRAEPGGNSRSASSPRVAVATRGELADRLFSLSAARHRPTNLGIFGVAGFLELTAPLAERDEKQSPVQIELKYCIFQGHVASFR